MATRSKASDGGQSGMTVHMRVPEKDTVTREFLAAQDNKSTSVRMLIRLFVARFGAVDVVEAMAQMLGATAYVPTQTGAMTSVAADSRAETERVLNEKMAQAYAAVGASAQPAADAAVVPAVEDGAEDADEADSAGDDAQGADTGAQDTSVQGASGDIFSRNRSALGASMLDDM